MVDGRRARAWEMGCESGLRAEVQPTGGARCQAGACATPSPTSRRDVLKVGRAFQRLHNRVSYKPPSRRDRLHSPHPKRWVATQWEWLTAGGCVHGKWATNRGCARRCNPTEWREDAEAGACSDAFSTSRMGRLKVGRRFTTLHKPRDATNRVP